MSKIQAANNYPDISTDGPGNPDNVGYPDEGHQHREEEVEVTGPGPDGKESTEIRCRGCNKWYNEHDDRWYNLPKNTTWPEIRVDF